MAIPGYTRSIVPEQKSSSVHAAKHGEEHHQDEWLISFIDIITLLLAAFVMMFAVNQYKDPPAEVGAMLEGKAKEYEKPTAEIDTTRKDEVNQSAQKDSEIIGVPDKREFLIAGLEKVIKGIEQNEELKLEVGEQQIDLSIGESVLFNLGDATLLPKGREIIDKIQPVLAEGDYQIVVEGFTDNLPINNRRYPSNWELSAARASSVTRYLINGGIDASRLQVSGFADTKPVATNETEEGRKLNRRVNLVLRVAG